MVHVCVRVAKFHRPLGVILGRLGRLTSLEHGPHQRTHKLGRIASVSSALLRSHLIGGLVHPKVDPLRRPLRASERPHFGLFARRRPLFASAWVALVKICHRKHLRQKRLSQLSPSLMGKVGGGRDWALASRRDTNGA